MRSRERKARCINRPLEPKDLQITDHRYGVTLALFECSDCGFVYAGADELAELTALYEKLTDPAYEGSQEARRLQMEWLLGSLRELRPQARTLLDIGAGIGLLVGVAAESGLQAVGVEPSRWLVEHARPLTGGALLPGLFPHPSLSGQTFDLITLVDVIEHVADPIQLLRDCRESLAAEGVLMVVTPDVRSLAARLLGDRWWHFRLAHVGYLDRHTLTMAARQVQLSPIESFRAKWFFPVRYLAHRSAEYLPVGWLNRLAERIRPLRWVYDRVIPLNLGDSLVMVLERETEAANDDGRT